MEKVNKCKMSKDFLADMASDLTDQIFNLLRNVDTKTALGILSDVVKDYGLAVASNLIRGNLDPQLLKNSGYEDYHYSEGNEEEGHIPLQDILSTIEAVLACDNDSYEDVSFTFLVRPYTDKELKEEGKTGEETCWFMEDKTKNAKDILIGFSG